MRIYEGAVTKSRFLCDDLAKLVSNEVFIIDMVGIKPLYNLGVILPLDRSDYHPENRQQLDEVLDELFDIFESLDDGDINNLMKPIKYVVLSVNFPKEYLVHYKLYEEKFGKKFFITIQEDFMPVKVYEV